MKKKLVFVFVILMVLGAGQVFAQQGFIQPTFGLGFATVGVDGMPKNATGISIQANVDFVDATGLTIGIKTLMASISNDWMDQEDIFPAFGIGYTFNAGQFCVGAKFMLGYSYADGIDPGISANGTFWVTETIGITGLIDLFFPENASFFGIGVGVSLRL